MHKQRYIVHVDMDAFFASIEQRDNPALQSKPVVVGADPKAGRGRGVVSTCSYEARRFGIRSAMPISEAWRRCPDAAYLGVDMDRYQRESERIYDIFYSFTPDIENAGLDEAFLDITESCHLFGDARSTCMKLKSKIRDETRLTASVGLAPTKMAAKIASDLEKPDGFVEVDAGRLLDFLWPLNISRIWGLGEKSGKTLREMGIATIGDLAKTDIEELVRVFGKHGLYFWQLANGIDERTVEHARGPKSISSEITFEEDTVDASKIESALMMLCEKVSGRLRDENFKCRTITLKIRLAPFQTFTRSVSFGKGTNFADALYKKTKELYNDFKRMNKRVRLLGVKASGIFLADIKDDLFVDPQDDRNREIHIAIDRIKKQFGDGSIYRAGILPH